MGIWADLTGLSQARAIRSGGRAQTAAIDKATGAITSQYNEGRNALSPYAERGNTAGDMLMGLFSSGGRLDPSRQVPGSQPFTFNVNSDPGAAFRLDQANKAFERSAAGRGRALGGGAARSLAEFNQGLASQEYGNAYNRYAADRSAGLAERQVGNQENEALFNQLFGLTNAGQSAAGNQAALSSDFGRALADLLTGRGNVEAASGISAANARASGVRGLLNTGLQGGALASLFL